MNLFTYGSLMFPEVWLRVAGQPFPSQAGVLRDFAAWKVRGETYPGLAPHPHVETPGVVYLNVFPDALARLDAFEGPFYQRTAVNIALADGESITAYAYVVAPAHRDSLEKIPWDAVEFESRHLASFLGPNMSEP